MAQIIDGYTMTPNIFAEDIGKHNISMYGSGDYVLSVGECLGYELVSNNEIRIKDGMFLTQGRRGLIKAGTADTCIIENGAQAVNRNDLIVMEYAKDEATLVESHTTKVIKGTPGEVAADPELVTGDIQNGAVLHQMPLYRVKIEGLNIVAVEQMFAFGSVAAETVDPMLATKKGFAADELAVKNQFDEQNSKLTASNSTPFRFGVNENGEYGYIITDSEGSDIVIPFNSNNNSGSSLDILLDHSYDDWVTSGTETFEVNTDDGDVKIRLYCNANQGEIQAISKEIDFTNFSRVYSSYTIGQAQSTYIMSIEYDGGSVQIASGAKNTDISAVTGTGHIKLYAKSNAYAYNGVNYISYAEMIITRLTLK